MNKASFLTALLGASLLVAPAYAYTPGPNVYYASDAGVTEAGLLAADNFCSTKNITCDLDASYTLTADRVLSARWIGSGGVITTGSHNLTCACSAPPTVPMFDKAGTGLVTLSNHPPVVYWDWYSASKNGTSDDSNAINRAVQTANAEGGGTAQGSAATYGVGSSVVVMSGVTLKGVSDYFGYVNSNPVPQTKLLALVGLTDSVVKTQTGTLGTIHQANVYGLNIYGNYPTVSGATYGIHVTAGDYYYSIQNVMVTFTASAGIYTDPSTQVGYFQNVIISGACGAGNGGSICGALWLHGLDNSAANLEAGCSQNALSSGYTFPSIMTAGIIVDTATGGSSTDNNIVNAMAEGCDVGYLYNSASNNAVGLRANFNMGDGIVVKGNGNVFTAPVVYGNARDAANTYECYYAASGSGMNAVDNLKCYVPGGLNSLKYAINDQVSYGALQGNQSIYSNVMTLGTVTQTYNFNDTFIGPRVVIPRGGDLILSVNSATPSVDNYSDWRTANTSTTSITNFLNGVNGQEITVNLDDTNTTIVAGSSIKTNGSSNITAKGEYKFKKYNGVWRETSGVAF